MLRKVIIMGKKGAKSRLREYLDAGISQAVITPLGGGGDEDRALHDVISIFEPS